MTSLKDGYIAMFGKDWYEVLEGFLKSTVFFDIANNIKQRRKVTTVYPESKLVFRAFRETGYYQTKIVILSQDPYPTEDPKANGLAFCCADSLKNSTSLVTMLKEIDRTYPERKDDIDFDNIDRGNLQRWAKQGVLLVNSSLTVDKGKPNSHSKYWELFTREVIKKLNDRRDVVFILMGSQAQKFAKYINSSNFVIKTVHPAAESYGSGQFVGSGVFKQANEHLLAINKQEIVW